MKKMSEVLKWNEAAHPRVPGGSERGGEFTSRGGTGTGHSKGTRPSSTSKHSAKQAIAKLISGKKADIAPSEVMKFMEMAAALPNNSNPNNHPDMTDLHVNGFTIFGGNGLGIKREDMPQIPDAKGAHFIEESKQMGIDFTDEDVSPLTLAPAQSEVSANRVGRMLPKANEILGGEGRIYVSKDNYVLDGHHRWALAAALAVENKNQKMAIRRMSLDHAAALKHMLEYGERHGIKRVSLSGVKKRELLLKYGFTEEQVKKFEIPVSEHTAIVRASTLGRRRR